MIVSDLAEIVVLCLKAPPKYWRTLCSTSLLLWEQCQEAQMYYSTWFYAVTFPNICLASVARQNSKDVKRRLYHEPETPCPCECVMLPFPILKVKQRICPSSNPSCLVNIFTLFSSLLRFSFLVFFYTKATVLCERCVCSVLLVHLLSSFFLNFISCHQFVLPSSRAHAHI